VPRITSGNTGLFIDTKRTSVSHSELYLNVSWKQ
jgi:hypothetical protein